MIAISRLVQCPVVAMERVMQCANWMIWAVWRMEELI